MTDSCPRRNRGRSAKTSKYPRELIDSAIRSEGRDTGFTAEAEVAILGGMTLLEFRSALPELRRLRAIRVALWGLDTDEKLAWQKRAQELIQKQQLEAPAHNRRLS